MTTKSTAPVTAEQINETALPTPQQIVNEGIHRVIGAHGIDVQKNRYKAMRAIAWQSFVDTIASGDFDALVSRAIANVDALPSGWEISAATKVAPKPAPAKTAPVKNATAR